eukprot:c16168_g1_i2.p1 GENE.c16168_g1_i2~~c16168_g1_i2.p1  ORF type:complete len:288 (-),score=16.24 c16168_g1_i2:117-980(-)
MCSDESGRWHAQEDRCFFWLYLTEICVRVTSDGVIDRSRSQFDQGGCKKIVKHTPESYLPFRNNEWPPYIYSSKQPSTIRVNVRSAADPYIEIQALTNGHLSFFGFYLFTVRTTWGWVLIGLGTPVLALSVWCCGCSIIVGPPRPALTQDRRSRAKSYIQTFLSKGRKQAALEARFREAVATNNVDVVHELVPHVGNINPRMNAPLPRSRLQKSLCAYDWALQRQCTSIADVIDRERKRRLRTFLMGTLRHDRHQGTRRSRTQASIVRMLPVDVLGMIAHNTRFDRK